ncbi:hypothetical protein LCGC14_2281860, partial [marine sediment metagenome]
APLALVIAPTRELAFQVMRELSWLYAGAGATVISCVGGMDMRDERRALERGAHIVVATPGRLRDHIQRNSIDLSDIRAVVLDEADEMLDLGFREDLEFILGEAPETRRTLMFSATVPPAIAKMAGQFQKDARRLSVSAGAGQHSDIEYQALNVAQQDAENAIINLLRYHDAQNAIVFANTRAAVARLTARFSNRGFSVVSLSGELSQTERTHALQAMRDGRARVCVATDVAARGIDLPNLELVIHAELPSNAEGLLHRSGRTGRAGRKGISALIVPPKIRGKAERLLKWAKISAEWGVPPSADEILARDEERLLGDEVWDQEPNKTEQAFAAKLLDLHSPERIAAAYLRLYRARQSAPEDLSSPDAKPERRDRPAFGPSTWVALSTGRNDRAEPRWILPLLCRSGDISKDDIGAIRIQPTETFVEISNASIEGFLAAVGPTMKLEDKITLRKLEGTPDAARQPRSDAGSDRKPGPRPDRKPPRAAAPEAPAWTPPLDAIAQGDLPEPKPRRRDADAGPRPKPRPADASGDRPKPRFGKPDGKSGDKPAGRFGKPDGRSGDKPEGKFGKPAGKFGKPGDKPAGKFG